MPAAVAAFQSRHVCTWRHSWRTFFFIIITAPNWALRGETLLFMFHHNKWKLVFLSLISTRDGDRVLVEMTFPRNRMLSRDIRRISAHSDDVDGAEREQNTKIMFSTSSLSKWKEKAGQLVLLKFWCSFVYSAFIFLFVLLKTPESQSSLNRSPVRRSQLNRNEITISSLLSPAR